MSKMKVVTIVGTRPEIIRLSRIIPALDDNMDHVLVHTGQNYDYELNEIFFKELGLNPPKYYLDAGGSSVETIGNVIIRIDPILKTEKPDAVLILGDTNSSLVAISAKKNQIPIFHMEAGNRCFDQRVPEEVNRKLVDHISDINMPYSDIAREYLINEGFPPDRIIKTGSPLYEVLNHYMNDINLSNVLVRLGLKSLDYFLISAHRSENVESDNFFELIDAINHMAEIFDKNIIFSTHPRTMKRFVESGMKDKLHKNIKLMKPLSFFDYVCLQKNAKVVLSDSGTITEESSILNFPALNIRCSHERPEGMEEGSVMMTGLEKRDILNNMEIVMKQKRGGDRELSIPKDYQVENVSLKVVRIIASYVGYVNRVVWRK